MSKSIRVKKGNEILEIQDSDLQSAVNDGYLPTERVIVSNSKTKETYEIDPEDLPNAFKDGFSYSDVVKKKEVTNQEVFQKSFGGLSKLFPNTAKALVSGGEVGTSEAPSVGVINNLPKPAPKIRGVVMPTGKTLLQQKIEASREPENSQKVLGYLQGLKDEDERIAEYEKNRITDFTPNDYEKNQKLYAEAEKFPGTLKYDLKILNAEQLWGSTITLKRSETSLPDLGRISLGGYVTVDRKAYIAEQKGKKDEWLAKINIPQLKANAEKSLELVKENIKQHNVYVEKNIPTFTTESVEGDVIPDVYAINNYAKSIAKKQGLSDEGYFKNLLYNELKATVAHKIIEPKVLDRFNDNYKKKYGKTLEEETTEEALKGFTEPQNVIETAKVQAKTVAADVSNSAKNEITALNDNVTKVATQIKADYETAAAQVKTPDEAKLLHDATTVKIDKLNQYFLKQQNLINSKYNARYRRQVGEIEKVANMKINDLVKKYKYERSPALQKKIETEYKNAYKEVVTENEEFKEAMDYALVGNFGRTFVTSLGAAIKGISSSIGFDGGKVLGDYMNSMYQHGTTELKSFSDFFDLTKLSKAMGSLAGGMLPSVAASAATAYATGGSGTPAALRMLYTGLAGWTAETVDISGRMYEDRFAETGSAAIADKSAKQSLESQVALMPFYAFDGLPFLGKSVKVAKSVPARILVGGTIELGTEMMQEYPQNLFEEAIKADKPYMEGLKLHSAERFKQTFLNIAPVFLLGAGGQATSVISEKRNDAIVKAAAKSFALKSQFETLAPAQAEQFLFDIMQRKGNSFATAYVGALFADGKITEADSVKLTKILKLSNDVITNSEKYGLAPAQQKVYAALMFYKERALNNVAEQTDPVFKKAAEAKVKQIEDDMVKLASGEKVDYIVLTYPNNEQYVLTTQVAEEAINNEKFITAYKNGDIKVATFGKRGAVQEKLDQLDKEAKLPPKKDEPVVIDQDRDLMDSEGELTDKEQNAIVAITEKDYSGSVVEPYTKVIQDPNSTVQEKKEALKGLSDQLLATATSEKIGTALGQKLSVMVEDLGYDVPVETKEVKDAALQQPITKPELIKQAELQEQKELAEQQAKVGSVGVVDVEVKDGKIIVDNNKDFSEGYPYLSGNKITEYGDAKTKTPLQKIEWALWRRKIVQDSLDKLRGTEVKNKGVKWANDAAQGAKSREVRDLLDARKAIDDYISKQLPNSYDTKLEAFPTYTESEKAKLAEEGILPKYAIEKFNAKQSLKETTIAGETKKTVPSKAKSKLAAFREKYVEPKKQKDEPDQAATKVTESKPAEEKSTPLGEVKEGGKAAETERRPVTVGGKKYNFIGLNKAGEEIYENEEGIRTKPASGSKASFVTEPVEMRPTKSGIQYSPNRTEEYMTQGEQKNGIYINDQGKEGQFVESANGEIFRIKENKGGKAYKIEDAKGRTYDVNSELFDMFTTEKSFEVKKPEVQIPAKPEVTLKWEEAELDKATSFQLEKADRYGRDIDRLKALINCIWG